MRMHNERSMSHHNMANDWPIPVYLKTTRQMTGCYGIVALRTISLWIPYLPPRREANHPGVTEFCQPLQVQSHLEMSGILVQLGHIQCT